MAPKEAYGCAKLSQRAGAEARKFGVWALGPHPLNRTFPAAYFPGCPLSVENHCFCTLGQSASFRHRYPRKKKSAKPEPATGMVGGDAQGALGTAGTMCRAGLVTVPLAPHATPSLRPKMPLSTGCGPRGHTPKFRT